MKSIKLTRIFDAPRHRVFGWWADAAKLQQWSGCKEAVRCEVVMDFRVGGSFTQKMLLAVHGQTCDYSLRGTYIEIVEPERIVYSADLGGATAKVTVEFFEESKGTRVVLTHEGLPNDFFAENISRGTAESFDKLEPLVNPATPELSR